MDITDPQPQTALTARVGNATKRRMEFQIQENYDQFMQSLKEEKDIRILVHTAGGSGHQSSAITILHLITRLWRNIDMTRVQEKTVHLIYLTDVNLEKLCKTESRLKDKEPVINHIRVVLEKDLPGLFSWTYRYGFACGYDDPANLAKKCKVQYFLRLQPLFWRHMDEIHFNDWSGEEEDVTTLLLNYDFMTTTSTGPVPLPYLNLLNTLPDFRCLGYFHQLPATPVWNDQDPVEVAIRTILQGADTGKFDLCVTYSIGEKTVFSNSTSEILFNLTTGFVCSKNRGSIQKNHVVILNFTLSDPTLPEQMEKLRLMLLPPDLRQAELEKMGQGTLKDSVVAAEKYVIGCGVYKEIVLSRLYFHCLDIGDNKLDNILNNNDSFHVILVNIPTRQQKVVFEYCLAKVTLFSVFEGSGSASVAATVGKPYLKFNALYPADGPHYLNFPNGDIILTKDTADFCQLAANSVAFRFSDWIKVKTIEELPCLMLAKFNALYKTGNKSLVTYFEAARAFYTRESNTRLFVSLGVFNMLIKNKEARKNTGKKLL